MAQWSAIVPEVPSRKTKNTRRQLFFWFFQGAGGVEEVDGI